MNGYPKDEALSPGSWYRWQVGSGWCVLFCDTEGHIGSLTDHDIADDGTVSPSVWCGEEGCSFHESVRLLDWTPT